MTDAWYAFYYGEYAGTEFSRQTTTNHFRNIQQDGDFICPSCGRRHVALRYLLPLGMASALLVTMALGLYAMSPPGEYAVAPIVKYTAVVPITAALTIIVAPGALWCVEHAAIRIRQQILTVCVLLLGLLVWGIGTFGLIATVIFSDAEFDPWMDEWVVWSPAVAQVVLLWFLWWERAVLLETFALRLNRVRLGIPAWGFARVVGWNSIQIRGMEGRRNQADI